MFYRRLPVLLFIGLVLLIIGCSNPSVTAIQVSPAIATAAVGQTVHFTATATYTQGTHQGSNQNASDSATWSSSNPSVATINSSGMATAVAAGTTVITASMSGFPGLASSTAELTVTGSAGGDTGGASFRSPSFQALNRFLRRIKPASSSLSERLHQGQRWT